MSGISGDWSQALDMAAFTRVVWSIYGVLHCTVYIGDRICI